jgi:hypothetical protein
MKQVGTMYRLATQLGVEVQPAGREPTPSENLIHAKRHLLDRNRESIDIPPEPVVTGVGVNAAKDYGCIFCLYLMCVVLGIFV